MGLVRGRSAAQRCPCSDVWFRLRGEAVAHVREDVVDLLADDLQDHDHDDGDKDEDQRVLDHALTAFVIVATAPRVATRPPSEPLSRFPV